ncbi:hypothetical protein IJG90_00755 [Candidatus Saccharibacteria bacterium]|nr:hypothetical protein [Candidatus Saccharibacteria bacterium]
MNKDVIYIEPDDDITDIITKIENSKEKIVAVVPPKKAGVFRSIVNIKLIAKAGAGAEKTVVLVTTDPSIVKLAAATRLPVTKDLQSAPTVPKLDEQEIVETTSTEEVIEKANGETETIAADEAKTEEFLGEAEVSKLVAEDEDAEKGDKKVNKADVKDKNEEKSKSKKPKKALPGLDNPVFNWVREHKKITIGCGIGLVVLILVLIWAFAIAPTATVTVGIRTTTSNFSENVTFTENIAEEDASSGKFYLDQKKIESKTEVTFEATGKKNVGEKATGEVVVYAYFRDKGSVAINAGTIFSISGLSYVSDKEATLSWDGITTKDCENNGEASAITSGCMIAARVGVTAEASGVGYNIAAAQNGWSTVANVGVYSDSAMTGGTDKTITVVQQSDVDTAKTKLETENESVNKQKLLDTLPEDAFVIESSFKQTVSEAVASPAVGEEVKDGEKPKLSVVTTDTIYVIDGTKVEEFIREKAKLADNYKIYEMNDPFVENFTNTDSGYVAKLKTSYVSGPKITESDVVEIVKGKGVGTARQDLEKAFDGISNINITTNFPWVMSIPSDNNKITVNIEVEEK